MQLFQKQKAFLYIFFPFQNFHSVLNIFEKKMTLIADVF